MGNYSSCFRHSNKSVYRHRSRTRGRGHFGMEPYNECEYWSAGPEVDEGGECWNSCEKNAGHKTFISVKNFELQHLPSVWQRVEFMKLIEVHFDLTVRLRVPYESRGENRVGTGYVYGVDPTPGHCPCQECKGQPGQRSWSFTVGTAKHVVEDDCEFDMISVDFFYDDDTSRKDGRMKTLKGGCVVKTRNEWDWRSFTCICHDKDLAEHMMDQVREREALWRSLGEWMYTLRPEPVVIVSHPHGMPKCVTVGEGRSYDNDRYMFTYSTDTCPGSSGSHMVGWALCGGPHHCHGGSPGGLNSGFYSPEL